MSQIGELAQSIFDVEFDSDAGAVSFDHIFNWLKENLGLLNTLINTSFAGEDPNMGIEAEAIYKELYLYNYYNKQARNVLRGITATTNAGDNILQVSDGDNSISFVNRNEVSKVYRDLAKDSKSRMDNLVAKYNIFSSKPLQVGGIEAGSIGESADAGVQFGSGSDDQIFDGGADEALETEEDQILANGEVLDGGQDGNQNEGLIDGGED
jgi:hypothetical protein